MPDADERPPADMSSRDLMSIRRKACIAGAYEHPTRKAPDKTVAQLHAECARGALEDAGLRLEDVDGYFCAGDAPGLGANSMADYLGLRPRHVDSTDTGGAASRRDSPARERPMCPGRRRILP
jgi:hypothetical protein